MNISAYPRTPMLSEDNVFITDSQENGTKGIKAKMLASQLLGFLDQDSLYAWYDAIKIPVWDRRRVYRGKNLGNSVTPLQQARIRNGTFEDLFIGDYWVINEHEYVILDFDYYIGSYETETPEEITYVQNHHLTMYMRNSDLTSAYDSEQIPSGGYKNSILNVTYLPTDFNPIIEEDFGNHIQEITLTMSNAVNNSGSITSYAKDKVKSIIPTSKMVYGVGSKNPTNIEIIFESRCLSYFELYGGIVPETIYGVWLRDIGPKNGSVACAVEDNITFGAATTIRKITPIFSIQYGLQGG